jgi:AcrR family transcriptional regulator
VSLAAIGYHLGSKDALMNQAVYEAVGDWSEALERALAADGSLDMEPTRRFESIMTRAIESFGGEEHRLWSAQLELMSPLTQNDELRTFPTAWHSCCSGSTPTRTPRPPVPPTRSTTPCSSASWCSGSWTRRSPCQGANSPRACAIADHISVDDR